MKTNSEAAHVHASNHNQAPARGLRVRTDLKAGKIVQNHNETQARGLRVTTSLRAGKLVANHNLIRAWRHA
jgi:hypothetical protein